MSGSNRSWISYNYGKEAIFTILKNISLQSFWLANCPDMPECTKYNAFGDLEKTMTI
jgi:hypothetical protein